MVCYQVACKLYILVHLWIHNMMIKYKTDLCTSFCSLFDTTLYGGFDLNKICGTIFDSFTRNLSKNRWYLVFPVSVTCGTRRLVVHGSDGGRNISKLRQITCMVDDQTTTIQIENIRVVVLIFVATRFAPRLPNQLGKHPRLQNLSILGSIPWWASNIFARNCTTEGSETSDMLLCSVQYGCEAVSFCPGSTSANTDDGTVLSPHTACQVGKGCYVATYYTGYNNCRCTCPRPISIGSLRAYGC